MADNRSVANKLRPNYQTRFLLIITTIQLKVADILEKDNAEIKKLKYHQITESSKP
jgi:hypothetical protein